MTLGICATSFKTYFQCCLLQSKGSSESDILLLGGRGQWICDTLTSEICGTTFKTYFLSFSGSRIGVRLSVSNTVPHDPGGRGQVPNWRHPSPHLRQGKRLFLSFSPTTVKLGYNVHG